MQIVMCSSVDIVSRRYYFNFVEAKEMPVVDSLIYCLFMIENSKTKINTFRVFFLRARVCVHVYVRLFVLSPFFLLSVLFI